MNISNLFKRNLWATFYFNFKMLPFRQAIKLPFAFYGKVRFPSLNGRIVIDCPIRRGGIQFGNVASAIFSDEEIIISIDGILKINGMPIAVGAGAVLEIGKDAKVELSYNTLISPRTKIIIREGLSIGHNFVTSWECQIFDSNFHYMRNVSTGEVRKINNSVWIGNNVWIGNRVTINNGTRLPNYSIVASGSLCNKDFTKEGREYLTIGGSHAKIITEGFERIFEDCEGDLVVELAEKERRGELSK